MKVIICESYDQLSKKAFEEIKKVLNLNPQAVLGLATGSTPVGLYSEMIKDHQENGTDYSKVKTFNLDEYVDLPLDHPESYHSFMETNLFSGLNIPEENIHIPYAEDENSPAQYDFLMEQNPVDIQILGIGQNGHIGFNEPYTPFDSKTHVVELTESTRNANKRFFPDEEVPTRAITQGIGNILEAKKLLLLANGEAKAQAVVDLIEKEVSEACPASALKNHDDVVVILDRPAASLLSEETLQKIKGTDI